MRTLIDRVAVRGNGQDLVLELTGNIVKMLALPGGHVPTQFESSVKVVAGARFGRNHTAIEFLVAG